jgi:DNA polymerase-4
MNERTIFLIDMNSFFASIEQAANPALRSKPIIVCGVGRTVVTTASYEARKFGIKTAMNLYEAKKFCPHVINVTGDLQKYADTSRRIQQILLEFTDQVEVFSIDECYLDVTHLVARGKTPEAIAAEIKKRIKDKLMLTCSIGIGPNKIVAKVAAKLMKPDGLVVIARKDIPLKYHTLSIDNLQGVGVGAKTEEKLRSLGLKTVGDLNDTPITVLNSHFGVTGYYLKKVGAGEDDSPVKSYDHEDEAKSFGHSYTLEKDTRDLKLIKAYLLMLSEKVCSRMRRDGMMGRNVGLTVRYADFETTGKQHKLKQYIYSGNDLYQAACKLFEGYLPLKKAVRLLGVNIGGLMPYVNQEFLFEEMEKKKKIVTVMDDINNKYGEFTIKPSSLVILDDEENSRKKMGQKRPGPGSNPSGFIVRKTYK